MKGFASDKIRNVALLGHGKSGKTTFLEAALLNTGVINRLGKVEKGLPTVSIGIYLRVLYALQLDDDILLLAKDDNLGRALQNMGLKNRQRATKKE